MSKSNQTSVRFSPKSEQDQKAWDILHSSIVKERFRSANDFVVTAIIAYYDANFSLETTKERLSSQEIDRIAERVVSGIRDSGCLMKIQDEPVEDMATVKRLQINSKLCRRF